MKIFDVYITKSNKFLPNDPISNDDMEEYLGKINNNVSKARRIVLRNNGIENRYYAIDKKGKATHTNADLTRIAIEGLFDDHIALNDIEVLSCGTSTPDQLLPSHAAMVHGLLKGKTLELNSSSGICCSGMNALKFGFLSIKSGNSSNAICSGSEKVSSWMLAEKFENEVETLKSLEDQPIIAFKKDFLRWMLSDGASAFLLENKPRGTKSLKIEWMEFYSFAHEIEACMYAGGDKKEDGSIEPWANYSTEEWLSNSIFSIKQDIKILDQHIVSKGVESMMYALQKNNFNPNEIDYFLPHVSSYYFVDKLYEELKNKGIEIPKEKWFMNLKTVGNVGSASIYLMVEELMNKTKLTTGQKIMLSVPESGRFSYAYALLTVV